MFIEQVIPIKFRCFGPASTAIGLSNGLTAFVGVNSAGKMAVMQALQRLFGVSGEQRRLRRQDFNVPSAEFAAPTQRSFILEAIIAFPELDADGPGEAAIPESFH